MTFTKEFATDPNLSKKIKSRRSDTALFKQRGIKQLFANRPGNNEPSRVRQSTRELYVTSLLFYLPGIMVLLYLSFA